jgi:NAD(P)-dependent dehydrogenase (short-subunit alcohol dehydrogenase family)
MRTLRELLELNGRVALITGGAGHIGLACGEALAELGARIVVLDRDGDASEARARYLAETFGHEATPLIADLEDTNAAASAVATTVDRFGRLDILVNNAAYAGDSGLPGYAVPLPDQTVEAWDAAMRVNLTAPFLLSQAAFPALAKSRGCIVNVGSIYGAVGPQSDMYAGTDMANPAAYGASKGGLAQLTRYLATTMAPDVRVNCISPGGVERGQPDSFVEQYVARTPLGRMATEEDFKGTFAYLATDASQYVTGQQIFVDGGWTAW